MPTIPSFKEMPIWQRAVQLATEVTRLTTQLPAASTLPVCGNLQDAALSIPVQLAKSSKSGKKAFLTSCIIARQTIAEIETELIIIGQLYEQAPIDELIQRTADLEAVLTTMVHRLAGSEGTVASAVSVNNKKSV